jgi:uncharacterized protein YrzB (UPF0473 family)
MEPKRLDIRLLNGFEERQEEIVLWLTENRKALFIASAFLLILLVLFFSLFFQDRADWGKARSEVEKDLIRLEKLEVEDRGELLALAKSIESHFSSSPEFPTLYEGRLSQALVQSGLVEEAERLLKDQDNRLTSSLPEAFKMFSQSSLMIAKGEFEKAWEKELELRTEIIALMDEKGDERWINTLFAFNLVRRTILADLLHKDIEAGVLKKEIFSLLDDKENHGSRGALEGLVEAYRIGQKTLVSYLENQGELASSLIPHLASEGRPEL